MDRELLAALARLRAAPSRAPAREDRLRPAARGARALPHHQPRRRRPQRRGDRVPALRARRRVRRNHGHLLARVTRAAGMRLRIWGCRGSLPTPGPDTVTYGGNTSCVELSLGDGCVFVLDA